MQAKCLRFVKAINQVQQVPSGGAARQSRSIAEKDPERHTIGLWVIVLDTRERKE